MINKHSRAATKEPMRKRFFITSPGTDIGKTFITAAMVRQAKALGRSAAAYKPVISGFDADAPEKSDTGILLHGLGRLVTASSIERTSPWRYALPLAPSMAAEVEERAALDFDKLIAFSREVIDGPEHVVLIEGAGGVMTPLDKKHTVLDWIEACGIPTIMVSGSYLGTISHTLTALAVVQHRKIPIHALVLDESEESSVSLPATISELKRWVAAPIISVGRRTCSDGWKDVPELKAIFD